MRNVLEADFLEKFSKSAPGQVAHAGLEHRRHEAVNPAALGACVLTVRVFEDQTGIAVQDSVGIRKLVARGTLQSQLFPTLAQDTTNTRYDTTPDSPSIRTRHGSAARWRGKARRATSRSQNLFCRFVSRHTTPQRSHRTHAQPRDQHHERIVLRRFGGGVRRPEPSHDEHCDRRHDDRRDAPSHQSRNMTHPGRHRSASMSHFPVTIAETPASHTSK